MTPRRTTLDRGAAEQQVAAIRRVRRNFWVIVSATTVAVGLLSMALRQPPGAGTALLTLFSSLAAIAGATLAARILVVTSHRRQERAANARTRSHHRAR